MLRRPLSAAARRCVLRRSALGQQRRVMATAPDEEQWTDFGKRFTADSGINRLMDDIALATAPGAPPVLMMGGGNPAQVSRSLFFFSLCAQLWLALWTPRSFVAHFFAAFAPRSRR